jgi:hypothetical protein
LTFVYDFVKIDQQGSSQFFKTTISRAKPGIKIANNNIIKLKI